MHEMGIANSILEGVHRELHRYPGRRAIKVGVRIGEFAGVDPESLRFCFDVLLKADQAEPLELDLEWCEAGNGHTGEELDFAYLELEDELETEPVEAEEEVRT